MSRRPEVRLSVGADELTVLLPDGRVRSMGLSDDPEVPLSEAVVRAIPQVLSGVEPGPLRWALMPPIADVRRIRMPLLREAEMTTVLARHVGRYFPSSDGEQAVGWRRVHPSRGAQAELLAGAADASLVDGVRTAMVAAGFEPGDPVVAIETWAAAATAQRSDARVALATTGRYAVLIRIADARAVDVVVLPAGLRDRVRDRVQDWALKGPLVVLGSESLGVEAYLREQLADGYELQVGSTQDAGGSAARFADIDGLSLATSDLRAERKARRRKRAARFWVAAAILLGLAGVLDWWGVRRELAWVEAERSERAAAVADALIWREALAERRRAIAALDSLARTAPAWAGLVADLTRQLPDDAYLEALIGDPDSVIIEGTAPDAAQVFVALRDVPGVRQIRARAPIRRETVGGASIERFSLAGRFYQVLGDGGGAPAGGDVGSEAVR